MTIDDRALPAVQHLSGAGARAVLDAAVTTAGGTLHGVRVSQVQYRPGSDIVVRYRVDVTWPRLGRRDETLFAAARTGTSFPDAIPVVAETGDGTLEASVWRWPHDPLLPGLPVAVTPSRLQAALAGRDPVLDAGPASVEVIAFRPTERAVARVTTAGGTRYVKVVPPVALAAIVDRHLRMTAAGLPVPPVVGVEEELGLLVLGELAGTTLRDRIKEGLVPWAAPEALDDLLDALAGVPVDGLPPAADRLEDAFGHAGLLRSVAPWSAPLLEPVTDRITARLGQGPGRVHLVHGDLHEAQLVVDGAGAVTGLLDVDDVGTGHPLADRSTLLGHLRFRATVADSDAEGRAIDAFADGLRCRVPAAELPELDLRTAAVLVGLATGPFRIQRAAWRDEVTAVLRRADELSARHEEVLNLASRSPQATPSS